MACSSRSSAPIASDGICRFATRLVTPRSAIGRSAGCPHASLRTIGPSHRAEPNAHIRSRDATDSAQDGLPSIHLAGAGIAAPARMSLSRACKHSLAAPATAALTARLRKRCGGLGSIRHRDASNALSAGPLRFCGFTCHCERSEAISIARYALRDGDCRVASPEQETAALPPPSWAGLDPPSTSSFVRASQDVDGRPRAFAKAKAGACFAGRDGGDKAPMADGTRNDMKAEPCGGTSLAPWQHIACTCWESGKNARVGPRDRRMSMVGAGPTQLGRCRAYLQAF